MKSKQRRYGINYLVHAAECGLDAFLGMFDGLAISVIRRGRLVEPGQ